MNNVTTDQLIIPQKTSAHCHVNLRKKHMNKIFNEMKEGEKYSPRKFKGWLKIVSEPTLYSYFRELCEMGYVEKINRHGLDYYKRVSR